MSLKLVECPRDAMQGIHEFIDTNKKIEYLHQLAQVGFDTIDCGSFVSPKAIPQMADTHEVVQSLEGIETKSKFLTIVANTRGAKDAIKYDVIDYVGFPFSISETFQLRNTNSTILESLDRVKEILDVISGTNKELVVYISMGFGNPYGDKWNVELCMKWVDELAALGIKIFAISDTIGVANVNTIRYLFNNLIPHYPEIEFGAHLHTASHNWEEKIDAAYTSGCRRFDSTIKGFGGCPMAKDELIGNMPTENIVYYSEHENIPLEIDRKAFNIAMGMANRIFPKL